MPQTPSQLPLLKRGASFVTLRLALLGACVGWFSRKALRPMLLPFGPARPMPHIQTYGAVDQSNDLLTEKHGKLSKIYERVSEGQPPLLKGPETVFFDDHGSMYTNNQDGNLIRLTDMETDGGGKVTVTANLVKDLGPGRPLGAKFLGNTLYIADAVLGLTRVQNVFDPKSKVEIIATTVTDDGKATRIMFADDLAVAPKSGMVYFSDASEVYPERDRAMVWDLMYASKVEALRGPSGRLLQYDPSTDEVTVLARDLMFANGVAVGGDESYVVYVETFYSRITKYYVSGNKKGTSEMILDGHPSPAWSDGIDCAWKGINADSSYCYSVGATSVVPAAKLMGKLPYPIDILCRTMLLMLPKNLTPTAQPYASVEIVDPETLEYVGILQDPTGKDISKLTGITLHQNKLYLGSLHNDFIGVYDLA